MRISKKIISVFCSIAILSSLTTPVYAANDISSKESANLWDYLWHMNAVNTSWAALPWAGSCLAQFDSWMSCGVCADSPDNWHHATSYEGKDQDRGGKYWVCTCSYCGDKFRVYTKDLGEAYDSYVETLPSEGLSSDGAFYWQPKATEVYICSSYSVRHYFEGSPSSSENVTKLNNYEFSGLYGRGGITVKAKAATSSLTTMSDFDFFVRVEDSVPVSGYYTAVNSLGYGTGYYLNQTGKQVILAAKSTVLNSQPTYYAVGSTFTGSLSLDLPSTGKCTSFTLPIDAFYCKVVPLSGLINLADDRIYNIGSRPSSIVGDYGIIGDNGQITKVDGNYIVDESNNTVFNPVTNTTTNITNWNYDYSDRSYHVTTDLGDKITITYGDEYVSIVEGDTIYNIYYVVDSSSSSGSGGDTPGADHTHSYADEVTKQPTCVLSGVRTYTCSCGDSYTRSVPATGHNWQISQQVLNEYDPETGELVQSGYTIYACSVCGEQYKSTSDSAPPNGSDSSGSTAIGDILSGFLDVLGDILGTLISKAVEALTGMLQLFTDFFTVIPTFFGSFIEFLAALFPFLPEETFVILNFGLILMIAAAIFRKFLK